MESSFCISWSAYIFQSNFSSWYWRFYPGKASWRVRKHCSWSPFFIWLSSSLYLISLFWVYRSVLVYFQSTSYILDDCFELGADGFKSIFNFPSRIWFVSVSSSRYIFMQPLRIKRKHWMRIIIQTHYTITVALFRSSNFKEWVGCSFSWRIILIVSEQAFLRFLRSDDMPEGM